MVTKSPRNLASEGHHQIYAIVDHFSNYIVPLPNPKSNAHLAVIAIFHLWISRFSPPQYLITDRATEYLTSHMANCCNLLNIRHSPRTSHAPWTNVLFKVQKDLATHLIMFLHDTSENWSIKIQFFCFWS